MRARGVELTERVGGTEMVEGRVPLLSEPPAEEPRLLMDFEAEDDIVAELEDILDEPGVLSAEQIENIEDGVTGVLSRVKSIFEDDPIPDADFYGEGWEEWKAPVLKNPYEGRLTTAEI